MQTESEEARADAEMFAFEEAEAQSKVQAGLEASVQQLQSELVAAREAVGQGEAGNASEIQRGADANAVLQSELAQARAEVEQAQTDADFVAFEVEEQHSNATAELESEIARLTAGLEQAHRSATAGGRDDEERVRLAFEVSGTREEASRLRVSLEASQRSLEAVRVEADQERRRTKEERGQEQARLVESHSAVRCGLEAEIVRLRTELRVVGAGSGAAGDGAGGGEAGGGSASRACKVRYAREYYLRTGK